MVFKKFIKKAYIFAAIFMTQNVVADNNENNSLQCFSTVPFEQVRMQYEAELEARDKRVAQLQKEKEELQNECAKINLTDEYKAELGIKINYLEEEIFRLMKCEFKSTQEHFSWKDFFVAD